jgi:excisionase family DNA binding protein
MVRANGRIVNAWSGGRITEHPPPVADHARAAPAIGGPDEFLSIDEVAAILRRSPRTIRRWIAAGDLPAIRIRGTTRIPVAALEVTLDASANCEESTE